MAADWPPDQTGSTSNAMLGPNWSKPGVKWHSMPPDSSGMPVPLQHCSWCACQDYCQKDPALQSIAEEVKGWVLGFQAYDWLQEFLLKMEGAFKQHVVWTSASEDHQSQAVEVSFSAML